MFFCKNEWIAYSSQLYCTHNICFMTVPNHDRTSCIAVCITECLTKIQRLGFFNSNRLRICNCIKVFGERPAFLILNRCTSRNPFVMICNEYCFFSCSKTSITQEKGDCTLGDFGYRHLLKCKSCRHQ